MAAWKLWGPGCECCTGCTGTICFTVKDCNNTTPTAGATVTLSLLGVTVGAGTTDSSGQCCIGITSAATYDYTVAKSGYETKTGTTAATCTTNNVVIAFGGSICVSVLGCSGNSVSGATVTVKSGGTTLGTQTTNSSGLACVQVVASTGSYTVEVSKSRFATDTSTRTIICGSTISVTLSVASGYVCSTNAACADPLPTVLYLTTPAATSVTLTWNGSTAWEGSENRSVSNATDYDVGLGCLLPLGTRTIPFLWLLSQNLSLSYDHPTCSVVDAGCTDATDIFIGIDNGYKNVASTNYGDPSPPTSTRNASTVSIVCPPSLLLTHSFTDPYSTCIQYYYVGTATITE